MADPRVGVEISADSSKLEAGLHQATENIKRFGRSVSDATKQMAPMQAAGASLSETLQRISGHAASVGKSIAVMGLAVKGALAVGVKQAGDFEAQLSNIGKTAGASAEEMKKVGDQMLALSDPRRTNQGAGKLTGGLESLVASGLSLKDAAASMETVGRVAHATGSEILDVSKTAFQLQNALKIDPSELTAAFDSLAYAGKQGAFELKDMAQFMPTLASAAGALGIQGRQGAASLAAMMQMVRKDAPDSAQAATRLTDAMLKMTSPEAVKNFKKFGVDIEAVMKRAKAEGVNPMEAALAALIKVTGGDQFKLGQIFGDKEAKLGLMSLMKYQEKYREIRDEAGGAKAAGTVDADFAKTSETFNSRLQAFQNSLQRMAIVVGNALMPTVKQVTDFINRLLAAFHALPQGTQETIARLAGVAAAFAVVAGAALMLAPKILALKELLAGAAFKSALTAIGGAISSLALPLAAVAAAAVAFYVAWRNNWGNIQEHTKNAVATVRDFVVQGFERLKAVVIPLWNSIWEGLQSAWAALVAEITPAVKALGAHINVVWNEISSIVSGVMAVIVPVVVAGFKLLWEDVKIVLAQIRFAWEVAWSAIRGVIQTVWPIISTSIQVALRMVRGVVESFLYLLQGNWKGAWDALVRTVVEIKDKVVAAVVAVINNAIAAIQRFGADAYSAGARLMQSVRDGILGRKQAVVDAATEVQQAAANATAGPPPTPTWQPDPNFKTNADAAKNQRELLARIEKQGLSGIFAGMMAKFTGKPAPSNSTPTSAPDGLDTDVAVGSVEAKQKKAKQPPRYLDQDFLAAQRRLTPGAVISSGFYDWRDPSKYRKRGGIHGGIDVAGMPAGSPVAAGLSGVVTDIARWYGNEFGVTIRDDSNFTTYGHISPGVKVGQPVRAGDVIGSTVIDHVDIKMRNAAGDLIDFTKMKSAGANKGGDQLYNDVMRVLKLIEKPTGEFDQKRVEINRKFDEGLTSARRQKMGPAAEGALEAQRQVELERVALMEKQAREKLNGELRMLNLEAQGNEFALRVEGIRHQATTEAAEWTQRAAEGKVTTQQAADAIAAIEVNRDRQIAASRWALFNESNALLQANREREQQEHQQRYDGRLRAIENERALNLITDEEAMARRAAELDATKLHGQALMDAQIAYGQQYQEYLNEQKELQGEQYVVWLQEQEQKLQELAATSTSAQVQLGLVRKTLHDQERTRWQQMRDHIKQIADSIGSHFQSFLENVLSGTKKFSDAFGELWKNIANTIIAEISRIIAKMIAMWIVQKALGFFTGGLSLGAGVGTSFTSFVPVAHQGGWVVPGGIQSFHTGGIVGAANLRPDEVIAKLQVGEMILSRDHVRSLRRGGGRGEQPLAVSFHIGEVHAHHTDDVHRLGEELYVGFARRMRYEQQGAR